MASERTLGQLVADASSDLSSIVKGEIALAKMEIKADVAKGGKGAGMLAGAGVVALFAVGFLLTAGAWGLVAAGLPEWAGFLIVAVVLLVVAGVLALVGKKALGGIQGKPQKTIANAQKTKAALKPASPSVED